MRRDGGFCLETEEASGTFRVRIAAEDRGKAREFVRRLEGWKRVWLSASSSCRSWELEFLRSRDAAIRFFLFLFLFLPCLSSDENGEC